jgi:hypothetical protein
MPGETTPPAAPLLGKVYARAGFDFTDNDKELRFLSLDKEKLGEVLQTRKTVKIHRQNHSLISDRATFPERIAHQQGDRALPP